MQQKLTMSASTIGANSHENEMLSEFERLLDERQASSFDATATERASILRRIVPLVLLAGVGAALALMPAGVKDVLITGRSVAHTPDR